MISLQIDWQTFWTAEGNDTGNIKYITYDSELKTVYKILK
jgi:hypothetical protein